MVQSSLKRPSSQDVANLAGVSRATVSAFLNDRPGVSDGVKERISEAIRELSYQPNAAARALKLKDTDAIGLILPVLSDFYTPLLRAINAAAMARQYDLILCSSESDPARERRLLQTLTTKRVRGILLAPTSADNADFIADLVVHIPIIQVNRRIPDLAVDAIVANNFRAGKDATQFLIDRGRRRVVFFGETRNDLAQADKSRGFQSAISATPASGASGQVIQTVGHGVEELETAFNAFLMSGQPFDGVIASSQTRTAVAMKLLREHHIAVPGKVSLIGFDDTHWAQLLDPPLTVVSEDLFAMGRTACATLFSRIEGGPSHEPVLVEIDDNFVVRQSA